MTLPGMLRVQLQMDDFPTKYAEGYARGYHNGRADRSFMYKPLEASLSSNIPGYATGYSDGFNGRAPAIEGVLMCASDRRG